MIPTRPFDPHTGSIFDLPGLPDLLSGFERELEAGIDRLRREVDRWLEGPSAARSPTARAQIGSIEPHLVDLLELTGQARGLAVTLLARPPSAAWEAVPNTNREVLVDRAAFDELKGRLGTEEAVEAGRRAPSGPAGHEGPWRTDLAIEAERSVEAEILGDQLFPVGDASAPSLEPAAVGLLSARERLRAVGACFHLDRPRSPTRLRLELRSRAARPG